MRGRRKKRGGGEGEKYQRETGEGVPYLLPLTPLPFFLPSNPLPLSSPATQATPYQPN